MIEANRVAMKTILFTAVLVLLATPSYSVVIADEKELAGDVFMQKEGVAHSQTQTYVGGHDTSHDHEGHDIAAENMYEDPMWIFAVTFGAICGVLGMMLSLYMACHYVKRKYNNRYGALHVSNPQTVKPV